MIVSQYTWTDGGGGVQCRLYKLPYSHLNLQCLYTSLIKWFSLTALKNSFCRTIKANYVTGDRCLFGEKRYGVHHSIMDAW